MILRSSRGEGRWQYSGKPCSYCGHRPWTTKENGRPPHWTCERPLLPRSEASSQNEATHDTNSTKKSTSPAAFWRRSCADAASAMPVTAAKATRPNQIKNREIKAFGKIRIATPRTRTVGRLADHENISRTKVEGGQSGPLRQIGVVSFGDERPANQGRAALQPGL